jgi:hypothetical protein
VRDGVGPTPVALWLSDGLRPRQPTPTPPPIVRTLRSLSPVDISEPPLPQLPTDSPRLQLGLLVAAALTVAIIVLRTLAGTAAVAAGGWRVLLPVGAAAAKLLDPASAAAALPPPPHTLGAPAILAGGKGADANVRRRGHGSIQGGILFVPDTFASPQGAYDLLLHFHGNTAVVRESAEVSGLNAIVAVVNLGVGSAPYQDAYAAPGAYEALLAEIQRVVSERGLSRAKLRRVALSSWSAGYGALSTILEVRRGRDPLDALLVLDGIHCGWVDEQRSALNARQLASFVSAARGAADDKLLFSITHAEIEPPTYAGAAETAAFLVDAVRDRGAQQTPASLLMAPPHLELRSAQGAVAKRLEKRMEPIGETRVGGLHVRRYRGETAEHHMAHLLQMGATVLPELAARWR